MQIWKRISPSGLFPPSSIVMPLHNYLGWLKEWNPVQNVWVHFYVLLRKFIQCDCSVASAVKHLNPWLKKGNTLTDVCLLLSLRPCFNNKPLFLLLGCSRKKNEWSNKAVRQISGARQQCNSNDRFFNVAGEIDRKMSSEQTHARWNENGLLEDEGATEPNKGWV